MLVLTRKSGQQIRIGNDVVVTVVSVKAGRVRLGFEAPVTVPIYRSELAQPSAAIAAPAQQRKAEPAEAP